MNVRSDNRKASAKRGRGRPLVDDKRRIILEGDPPNPSAPPSGCAFRNRCARARPVCADAVPALERRSPGGSLVACGSLSLFRGLPGKMEYAASKAGVAAVVRCLAAELGEFGIRANVVSPGTTYFKGGHWHKVELEDPETFAEAMKGNPTGRMATAEDIANAVAFVASPAAGFVVGANIVVDGGFTHRIQN